MKLSGSCEQGIAIILLIAQSKTKVLSAKQISNRLNLSLAYSQKILRKLVVANLIKSTPGINGGFLLANSTKKISLLDIIQAINNDTKNIDLPTVNKLNRSSTLAVTKSLKIANLVWRQVLSETYLSDLLDQA